MEQPKTTEAGIVDVNFGLNVTVVKPVNLYGCKIGDDSFIGPFIEIQRNVTIGKRCRVQSHAFICELVNIGDDCFISHGAMFVNDLLRNGQAARDSKATWKPTSIGNHVNIGTNAVILPVSICDHVVIGAGSIVTKNIYKPGIYAGNPAKFLRAL